MTSPADDLRALLARYGDPDFYGYADEANDYLEEHGAAWLALLDAAQAVTQVFGGSPRAEALAAAAAALTEPRP